jgi:glycerol-1-phosphate dehydrogenase [NAD(P)+]
MGFLDKTINELINTEYPCSCGRTHIAEIENIAIGKNAIAKLPEFIQTQKLNDGRLFSKETDQILVVSDVNTRKAAGEKVFQMLKDLGYHVSEYCFQNESMHAEDCFAEELQQQLFEGLSLIVTVGSGSLNDITRYVAFHAKLPYYIVATAPSMDGYASNVSPLVHNNLKITYICQCANAIIGDVDFLATCPTKMIGAGLGDILGKYLAIHDWKMSSVINGEYYCDEVAQLVLYSVQKCVDNVPGLLKREPEALQYLMESLVLIGIAMSYIGVSRPASSSEHHIAHFLEMKSIFKGEYGELHGTNVGMATCLIHDMYQKFLTLPIDYQKAIQKAKEFDYAKWEAEIKRSFGLASDEVIALYQKAHQNDPDEVICRINSIQKHEKEIRASIERVVEDTKKAPQLLKSLGGLISPEGYGLSKDDIHDILMYAKDLRNRYAALQFFYDLGVLEELADDIVDRYM